MSPIIILSGSRLLASCLAASLARLGAATQVFDHASGALDALRQLAPGILILHPRFGRAIDLSPMRRLAESNASARCILLTEPDIEAVANATVGLPPHCRVSLQSDLDTLITCIHEGRSKEWGRSGKVSRSTNTNGNEVTLPDGVVLTPAQAGVLRQHCRGKSAVQIAELRGGSARTVESHMKAIRERTGIDSNVEMAVRYAGWSEESIPRCSLPACRLKLRLADLVRIQRSPVGLECGERQPSLRRKEDSWERLRPKGYQGYICRRSK